MKPARFVWATVGASSLVNAWIYFGAGLGIGGWISLSVAASCAIGLLISAAIE